MGPLDPVAAVVAPVPLAAARVEGEAERLLQAFGDQVFDVAAVEVGALDLVAAAVGPVHAAPVPVQGKVPGFHQPGDQGAEVAAVELSPLDAVAAGVGPVEPGHSERGLVGGLHGDGEGPGCLQAARVAGGHGDGGLADGQQPDRHQGIGNLHRGDRFVA